MSFNNRIVALLQMPISPVASDYVLNECRSIEETYRQISSTYRWTLEYKRFQVEILRGNKLLAIAHLKRAIAFAPYNNDILSDYKSLVGQETSVSGNLVLLISCKKYENKAVYLAAQFDAAGIEYLIISGNDTPAILHPRALQVEAPDNYESLPLKVAAACAWVFENMGPNVGILKVDDDQTLSDPAKLKAIVARLHRQDAYAGVPVSGLTHDRNWHWNKCEDKALNTRTYGRPFLRHWAMGGAYYLAPGPLSKLVLSLMRFPGLLESEYYEDKLVGDVLALEKVELTALGAYEDFGLTLTEQHRFNVA